MSETQQPAQVDGAAMHETAASEAPDTADMPLPLPYVVDNHAKHPLPGVQSVFLTGTTLGLVGVEEALAAQSGAAIPMTYISKEKLTKDMQFRGAISDFHPIKEHILNADYDPLLLRSNVDDLYGDGNNFELATSRSAAEVWEFIDAETERRRQQAESAATEQKAAKALQPSKKSWAARPWQCLGSDVELEEAAITSHRPPCVLLAHQPRRAFHQVCNLSDKDSSELWNSSQMECRPFKDPTYDLRRMEQDTAVQAVPLTQDLAVQATPARAVPGSTQYEARSLAEQEKENLLTSEAVAQFLDRVWPRCNEALQQNEVTNIFEDDFAFLGDDDSGTGNRKENTISEYQSFTDLQHSKGKAVSAIHWLPHRKGVVAVACTDPQSFNQRVDALGGAPASHAVLIWNFRDPIHPELILESPYEVFCFQSNPLQPEVITGGCYNGQIIMWDTASQEERIAQSRPAGEEGKASKEDAGSEERGMTAVVKGSHLSLVDASHTTCVTDLQWLPGMSFTRDGRPPTATKAAENPKAAGRECNFFATTAGDGRIMFWDMRVGHNRRKVKREREDEEVEWRPTCVVHLTRPEGGDLGALHTCFNLKDTLKTTFFVGSSDGELVYADWIKPEGEEHPDYSKACVRAHNGAIISLQRSPFFEDVVVSVGDWSLALWKEGQHQTPLFTSPHAPAPYTAGCWSPTRPGVIYAARADGVLEVWDLLDRSHEPSMTAAPCTTPITYLAFSPAGAPPAAGGRSVQQLLAVGDGAGVLHIMDLPRNLRRRVPSEVNTMHAFLTRHLARLDYLQACKPRRAQLLKEHQERQKIAEEEREAAALAAAQAAANSAAAAAAAAAAGEPVGVPVAAMPIRNANKDIDEQAEEAYRKMEDAFRVQLGLVPDGVAVT
ncbi:hypothetical protein WJX82_000717 [Trebouxia sp. C0006]